MLHVPVTTLCFSALIRKYDLKGNTHTTVSSVEPYGPGNVLGRATIITIYVSYLITRRAPWFEKLSMVSSAEDLAILVEIDQIHQQLLTCGTHKARWVPAGARACSGGKNCHFPSVDASTTLTIKHNK